MNMIFTKIAVSGQVTKKSEMSERDESSRNVTLEAIEMKKEKMRET